MAAATVDSRQRPRTKDVLLEHVSRDVKALHVQQSDLASVQDALSNHDKHTKNLCDHLDLLLMHGLYNEDSGYWDLVSYFSRKDVVGTLCSLSAVKTWKGRGRAWMCIALNEQSMECYFRMFTENQDIVQQWYSRDAFLRDIELLLLLQTLLSGLDYITFDLSLDEDYFDDSASPRLLKGVPQAKPLDFNINPSFHSLVTPEVQRKQRQTALLSASLPASFGSLPISQSVTPSPPGTATTSDSETTTVEPAPLAVSASNELTDSVEEEKMVEKKMVEEKTVEENMVEDFQKPNVEVKQELTLLERMSLAESASRSHGATRKTESAEGVAVTSRQRKSKGRKKKRRPKDIPAEEERRARRGSDPELRQEQEEFNEAKMTPPQSMSAEQQDAMAHVNTTTDQEIPAVAGTPAGEWTGGEETPTSEFSRLPTREDDGTTRAQPEAVIEKKEEDVSVEDSQPISEQLDAAVCSVHDDTTSGVEQRLTTGTITKGDRVGDEGEDERRTVGSLSNDSGPSEHSSPQLARIQYSMNGGEEEEEDEEIRDLKTMGTMAVAARRGSRQRGRSDALSSPLRSTGDYCVPEESSPEGERQRTAQEGSESPPVTGESAQIYDKRPDRPDIVTDWAGLVCDVVISENTRLVFALEVFQFSEENFDRLVQVRIPSGLSCYQTAYVTVTNEAVYLVLKDGTEGTYSRMLAISYKELHHIIIGLSWQSLGLVYTKKQEEEIGRRRPTKSKQIIITGNEAVSRSLANLIRNTAGQSPSFHRSIPLNKDDESRICAIERELIKLGSSTSMDVVRYSLVHWEQLLGEPPSIALTVNSKDSTSEGPLSGTLQVKGTSLLGSGWRQAYFVLKNDTLFQYNAEYESSPKASYPLRGLKFGGCTRASSENKPFAFQVIDSNGSSTMVAAESEEEMTTWMQALCMAACEESPKHSPVHNKGGIDCAVMLTNSGLHVMLEDWSNESVRLVTSVSVVEVTEIGVDKDLPYYCTLLYEDSSTSARGLWMLCFSSEYELGQFETAFNNKWKEYFEVDITFTEMLDPTVKARAKRAVELMKSSSSRSDSITRGRTEYSY